ncbi:DNA internalization-related competence protein ComEC/Rec2 [Ferdinandcohnia sp. Marseille-Q9671]
MNRLQLYFRASVNFIGKYRDHVTGKFIFLALFSIFGILVPYTSFYWLPILLTLFLLGYVIFRHQLTLILLCIITLFSFMVLFLIIDSKNQTKLPPTATSITAELLETPDINGDKFSVIVNTTNEEKLLLTYYFQTEEEMIQLRSELRVGFVCTFTGTLNEPQVSRNPHAFHYQRYLYTQKIHWIYEASEISLEKCMPQDTWSIKRWLLQIREVGINQIDSHFEGSTAGIIQALIYGERTNISVDIVDSYQSLGLIHLLAISGLHVSLMTGMFYFLCIRFGMTRENATTLLLVLLPAYIIIAGGSPSVIRSAVMSILLLVSIMWWKKSSMLDVISIACIGMLASNPYLLVNIGFQLSFIVSASLIVSSRVLFKQYTTSLSSLVVVSFLAQLCSLPILLYHFYEFSILSLPLNILYVPLYSVCILPFALFTVLLLGLLEPVGQFFAYILSYSIETLNQVTVWFSDSAFSVLTPGKPGVLLMMLYCASIFVYLIHWEKKKHFLQVSLLGPITVFLIHLLVPYINPYGEVTMLDVGQGDSIVIELPYRKGVYLIDTGGIISFAQEPWRKRRKEFSTSEDIIIPFLKSKGVRHLDKVIITHGDQDHIGGAKKLIENIKVKEVLLGKNLEDSKLEEELKENASKEKIKITIAERGYSWKNENHTFHILAPNGNEMNENDNSIVIYTRLGGLKWLFTGDLEKDGEIELIKTYVNLKADVLKVGHHGSLTSSTEQFIQLIRPKIGLIPVGENNRFNHPHPDVVNRFKESSVKIYRTDQDGAIQYRFFRNSGTFMTSIP